jgi:2-polyprenyl-6-methoxyphenol hydroxylase-like FAD-dependent oxidoreductase
VSGPRRALVVGGGIGGLAAALGLLRGGWDVQVLERRTAGDVAAQPGSGISIWPNAIRALAALGVHEQVLAGAALGGRSGVRTPSGRWLARTDIGDAVRERFGLPLIITTRQRLAAGLAGALGAGRVEYGLQADAVDAAASVVRCGGQAREADLVVVADGARSRLRGAVLGAQDGTGPQLVYAGYTSWRFIAPRPAGPVEPAETWGHDGQRFAVVPVDADRVYCYATASCAPGGHAADEREELRARFSAWHPPIPGLLGALPPDAVIRTDITYLSEPPDVLHRHRTVLLGDAAHAMTPDLGQGGCQALEDAATLGALLPARLSDDDVTRALARYTSDRAPRAADIVRRSVRAGRLYQSPLWLRGLAARASGAVPARAVVRALAPVIAWTPSEGTVLPDDAGPAADA